MTQQAKRVTLFDAWAAQYDLDVATNGDDFPFAGYDEVLATAVRTAGARPSLRVLELGIPTRPLSANYRQFKRYEAANCYPVTTCIRCR